MSVDASTKDSLKKIDRPLFRDFWERFVDSLKALRSKVFSEPRFFLLFNLNLRPSIIYLNNTICILKCKYCMCDMTGRGRRDKIWLIIMLGNRKTAFEVFYSRKRSSAK